MANLVLDRGKYVAAKTCAVCARRFTWRKKWERCWDEVTTCSKRCNTERRRRARRARKEAGILVAAMTEPTTTSATTRATTTMAAAAGVPLVPATALAPVDVSPPSPPLTKREARKQRKREMKAARRARREGRAPPEAGRKCCETCGKSVDLLVRCQVDESRRWFMVCGACWGVHSGGVPDGDAAHPFYRYGGVWKNLHKMP